MISDVLSLVCLVGDDAEKGEDEASEHGKGVWGCQGDQRGTALAPLVCILSHHHHNHPFFTKDIFLNLVLLLHNCMTILDMLDKGSHASMKTSFFLVSPHFGHFLIRRKISAKLS